MTPDDIKFQQLLQAHHYVPPTATTTAPVATSGGWYERLKAAQPAPRPAAADVAIGAGKTAASFVEGADVLGTMNRIQKGDTAGMAERLPNLIDSANPLKTMHSLAGDNTDWTGREPAKQGEVPDWSGTSPAQREEAAQPSNYMQKVGRTATIVAANVLPLAGGAIKEGAGRLKEVMTPKEPTPEEIATRDMEDKAAAKAQQEALLQERANAIKEIIAPDRGQKLNAFSDARQLVEENPEIPQNLARSNVDLHSTLVDNKFNTEDMAKNVRADNVKASRAFIRPLLQALQHGAKGLTAEIVMSRAAKIVKQNINKWHITADVEAVVADRLAGKVGALGDRYSNARMSPVRSFEERINYDANSKFSSTLSDTPKTADALANRAIGRALRELLPEMQLEGKAKESFLAAQEHFEQMYRVADFLESIHGKTLPQSWASKGMNRLAAIFGAAAGHSIGGGILPGIGGYVMGSALEHAVENLIRRGRGDIVADFSRANPGVLEQLGGVTDEINKYNQSLLQLPQRTKTRYKNIILKNDPAITADTKGRAGTNAQELIDASKSDDLKAPKGKVKPLTYDTEIGNVYDKEGVIPFGKKGTPPASPEFVDPRYELPTPKPEEPGMVEPYFDPKASGAAPKTDLTQNPQAGFVYNPLVDLFNKAKGLDADQIMAKHPDIQLKRDVPALDAKGNKTTIPEGEILTPYQMKGDKVMLKDGQTYIVSKNQYQNIKNNAVVEGAAQDFAPEMKGLEDTVRGPRSNESLSGIAHRMYGRDHITLSGPEQDAVNAEWRNQRGTETKFSAYTLPGGKNYKEILVKAPLEMKQGEYGTDVIDTSKRFRDPHWQEENPITSIRLNERDLPNNKGTATFLEEEQSDWGRARRKQQDQIAKGEANEDNIPHHDLLDKHTELGVKRGLQEAVKNGSDYFAWINGEQTSARYDLATHLDGVEWEPAGSHTVVTLGTKKGGAGSDIELWVDESGKLTEHLKGKNMPSNWSGKRLDEVLGKGLADKIMAQKKGILKEEGLKFGGEWAKNLYDKQIPNIVKDLTGAKVETLDMGLPVNKQRDFSWETRLDGKDINMSNPPTFKKYAKVGMAVRNENGFAHVITKLHGGNTFAAIPMNVELANRAWEVTDKGTVIINRRTGASYRVRDVRDGMTPEQAIKNEIEAATGENEEIYDISPPMSKGQMAIKLTPEIIAKIKGEPIKLAPKK